MHWSIRIHIMMSIICMKKKGYWKDFTHPVATTVRAFIYVTANLLVKYYDILGSH